MLCTFPLLLLPLVCAFSDDSPLNAAACLVRLDGDCVLLPRSLDKKPLLTLTLTGAASIIVLMYNGAPLNIKTNRKENDFILLYFLQNKASF